MSTNLTQLVRDIAEQKLDPSQYTEEELSFIKHAPILQESINIKKFIGTIRTKARKNKIEETLPDFILLLQFTNLSPVKAAELLGISWYQVLAYSEKLDREGNSELSNLLRISKRAYAETIMMHPENYQGNSSMAIFMAKSLAGWTDGSKNEFGVPSDQEMDAILKAREELMTQFNELEEMTSKRQLKIA